MDTKCLLCGKDAMMPILYIYKKHICVNCQREIAKAYADTCLDPVKLLFLKHADGSHSIEMKCARR